MERSGGELFRTRRDALVGAGYAVLGALSVFAFHDAGEAHGRYVLESSGLERLPPNEIQFLF